MRCGHACRTAELCNPIYVGHTSDSGADDVGAHAEARASGGGQIHGQRNPTRCGRLLLVSGGHYPPVVGAIVMGIGDCGSIISRASENPVEILLLLLI
jgi:hypothetical protein